jgi:2-isopropylmalate synthase
MQVELAQLVQRESEQHNGEVASATIHQLFVQNFIATVESPRLNGYRLHRSGGSDTIEAEISEDNVATTIHGKGEGALSAFINAWQQHSGQHVVVVDYSEHAIGAGTDAEAAAYVQLNIDGQRSSGAARDHDTVSASLMAVMAALNRASTRLVA